MATYDFDETIELLETEVETVKENSDEPSKATTGHQREKQYLRTHQPSHSQLSLMFVF